MNKKNTLVCVSGMSPAIITETYYWLARCRHSPIIADELVIITTGGGRQKILDELINAPNNRFEKMAAMYGWPVDALKQENIYVAKDSAGLCIDDVRTGDEFNFFANQVLDVIREKTQDEHTAVHASLAGGRKTMSYYLGLVMNIFGRKGDSLSHVLLKPEYEQASNFYYPGQSEALLDRAGKLLDLSCDEENIVEMSEFPLINLATSINVDRLRNKDYSFEQVLKIIKDEQDNYVHSVSFKKIERNKNEISFGKETRVLEPAHFALLLLLGYHAKQDDPVIDLKKDSENPSCVSEKLKEVYLQYVLLRDFVKRQEINLYDDENDFIDSKSKELKNLEVSNYVLKYFESPISTLKKVLKSVSPLYLVGHADGKHQVHINTLNDELFVEVQELFEKNNFVFDLSVEKIAEKLSAVEDNA